MNFLLLVLNSSAALGDLWNREMVRNIDKIMPESPLPFIKDIFFILWGAVGDEVIWLTPRVKVAKIS